VEYHRDFKPLMAHTLSRALRNEAPIGGQTHSTRSDKDTWARLKRSKPEMQSASHPFVKDKWDERAYFLVQDVLYEGMDDGHVSVNAGISDLAILAFIRATCSRPGALAKDWFVLRCRRRGPLRDVLHARVKPSASLSEMNECGSLVKPKHVTDACTSGPSMYEVGTILV